MSVQKPPRWTSVVVQKPAAVVPDNPKPDSNSQPLVINITQTQKPGCGCGTVAWILIALLFLCFVLFAIGVAFQGA